MKVLLSVCGRFLIFVWRNKETIIPVAIEGYNIIKRWRKINKLKRAQINNEL
jgi:hypothetical protein